MLFCSPSNEHMHSAGIDYGSKFSGNTTIAITTASTTIEVFSSKKGKDADEWLEDILNQHGVCLAFIDAPLSLPSVYQGKGNDFMFRQCDRQANAMSPMFLGGLTARAMQLKNRLKQKGIELHETYPSLTVKRLPNGHLYSKKKTMADVLWADLKDALQAEIIFHSTPRIHEFDALLALLAAKLFSKGLADMLGNPDEGTIIY